MFDPEALYFRIRDNGALVFRKDTENQNRRLELVQIAAVNARNSEIKPHNREAPTDAEMAQIEAWLAGRQVEMANHDASTPARVIEELNLAAQWAQARAEDGELRKAAPDILMALHDLRATIVKRLSHMDND